MKSFKHSALADFTRMVLKNNHPCIMAQSVMKNKEVIFKSYKGYQSSEDLEQIMADLKHYSRLLDDREKNQNMSFIATFPNLNIKDEADFEQFLWSLLHDLHQLDEYDWDKEVSNDPSNPNFSFSLHGRSFYIIGMHPNSSRLARQSKNVSIIFNLHSQFERLRKMGVYDRVRDRIRQRDKKLQGSVNPMLANFGTSSEALQYSGRKVDTAQWKCPYTFTKYAWQRLRTALLQAG